MHESSNSYGFPSETLVDSINKIPQRIISEQAITALKDALRLEFKQELAQQRQDLQAQIDELKK
jgi:hypothetical protein